MNIALPNGGPKRPLRESAEPDASAPETYRLSPALRALESPPKSATAIALHDLAADLFTQQISAGRRGLVVCGPHAGAGVTFTAANLAIALAQAGASVLLMDANLEDPGLHKLIEPLAPTLGLSSLLEDADLNLDRALHREVLPRLSILFAGPERPLTSELIANPRCKVLLRQFLREFDYTIVDTPPANRAIDARRCAAIVGYAMIVARDGDTYVDDVHALREELLADGVAIAGCVLNGR
jgi:capsular exopolysaccharide synthesis family protein